MECLVKKLIAPLAIVAAVAAWASAAPDVQLAGVFEGQVIGGIYYDIEALVDSPVPITRVEFYLSGVLFRTETAPPYVFNGEDPQGVFYGWDTTIYPNGEYEIRADAYDEDENAGTATVSFNIFNNHPPTASCEADVNFGILPMEVTFTGHASDPENQELLYNWNFGDGAQSNEQNPIHTFTAPGVYIVRFTVADPNEASASSRVCIRAGILPYLEQDGTAVTEAEDYDLWFAVPPGQEWSYRTDKPGYSGVGLVQDVPDIGVIHFSGLSGPSVQYWIDLYEPGRYYVWLRGYATSESRSCKISINGDLACDNVNWSVLDAWAWTNRNGTDGIASIDTVDMGVNILTVYGREDGLAIDKIILTSDPAFIPFGLGPEVSPREARRSDVDADCTFDGVVNILDMIFIRNRLLKDVNVADNRWADVTGDNVVNILDLIHARNNLNNGGND